MTCWVKDSFVSRCDKIFCGNGLAQYFELGNVMFRSAYEAHEKFETREAIWHGDLTRSCL